MPLNYKLYKCNYIVFKDGRIFSKFSNKFLKTSLSSGIIGYKKVAIYHNKKRKMEYVHRILATLFIPNPHNKPCVDHIDRCKTNNSLSNLRWVTVCENNWNRKYKGSLVHNKCFDKYVVYYHLQPKVRQSVYFKKFKDAFEFYKNLDYSWIDSYPF